MDTAAPKRVVREATQAPWFRALARLGYVSSGVVHGLIGLIALIVAFGGDAATDQTGALRAIAALPLGFTLLWIIAAGFFALAVWKIAEGLLVRGDNGLKRWGARVGQWGQAVVFATFATVAGAIAFGARLSSERAAEQLSRGVLEIPGGIFLLIAVGVGVGVTGISFLSMGVRRSYRSQVSVPDGSLGRLVDTLGIVGFIAKGVALVAIAVLLVVAAVRNEARTAGGLDGALGALLDLAFGPLLVGIIGIGFIAYGLFCFFRARYARM
ncbi:conserved membrane hypothetical protein [Microbacterium sp. C448]|uniref:DUF1206 domain-containing protein n=1 Tax=Microbacterium sp. C448 TaxID=1177594 RepID=UPI0003DE5881|nr:DUF1206 domain-containing protein [Microbacterium sp. C448]CDK01389.1 conserved membrane hypothetical protein [Microbacterium sp. C448]